MLPLLSTLLSIIIKNNVNETPLTSIRSLQFFYLLLYHGINQIILTCCSHPTYWRLSKPKYTSVTIISSFSTTLILDIHFDSFQTRHHRLHPQSHSHYSFV